MVLKSRHTVPLALLTLVIGAITVAQALLIDWVPETISTEGPRVDWLLWVLFWASAVFFVLVTVVLIYSVWAFRIRPGEEEMEGLPIHGNTRLEVVWTVIPAILLVIVAVLSIVILDRNEVLAAERTEVTVTAQQFAWSYTWVEQGIESGDLRVPVDTQVQLNIRAADVIHAWWVPEVRVKQDAVPGITTRLLFTPEKTGTYEVICAELCGAGHGVMRSRMIVMEPNEYSEWLAGAKAQADQQRADADESPAPAEAPAEETDGDE